MQTCNVILDIHVNLHNGIVKTGISHAETETFKIVRNVGITICSGEGDTDRATTVEEALVWVTLRPENYMRKEGIVMDWDRICLGRPPRLHSQSGRTKTDYRYITRTFRVI